MARDPSRWAVMDHDFQRALGLFHSMHSTLDLTIDYAIGKFLNIPPAQTHLITSGLMFGKKARLLDHLIRKSDHPKKSSLLENLGKLRGSKRDAIVHSYVWSDPHIVTFIERTSGGDFKVIEHKFSVESFKAFVVGFAKAGEAFYQELGTSTDEIEAFAKAAFALNHKSKTSARQKTRKRGPL